MPGDQRPSDGITTDLLAVWTDPDTAMEAVGRSLGVFGERSQDSYRILRADAQLRSSLSDQLLDLVDRGTLEMRPCGDGRNAFRWRDGVASALTLPPERQVVPPEQPAAPRKETYSTATEQAALLLISALSCVLVVVAFIALSRGLAMTITAGLLIAGVIGVIRRVPFAGAWTVGLTIAGCLLHFS